jgi:hypothetical protein
MYVGNKRLLLLLILIILILSILSILLNALLSLSETLWKVKNMLLSSYGTTEDKDKDT